MVAPWITQPTLFYLVDTTGGRNVELTRILVDVTSVGCLEPAGGNITASPNPVQACSTAAGRTTISWSTRNVANAEVRVDSSTGSLFAAGPYGSAEAPWIQRSVFFYLIDISAGRSTVLSQVLVDVATQGCLETASGTIAAIPGVVQYCGTTAGTTNMSWSTRNALSAEVRVGSLTGALFARGVSGSADAPWIQRPTLFYLNDNAGP